MNSIKHILLFAIAILLTVDAPAQSFPPNSYPASIKVITDAGVAQYWNVKRIMCLGKSGSGYKFRIYGQAGATTGSQSIEMFYILPDERLQSAGVYLFPAITKGDPFQFEITSAFAGYAPDSFLGFMIKDEDLIAPEPESTLPEPIAATSRSIEIPIIEDEEVIVPSVDTETIYQAVETPPSFPGGEAALFGYIADILRYPVLAWEKKLQGRVVVRFVIDIDGSVADAEVIKGVSPELDFEAVRVIKALPKFTPGKIGNTAVKTLMSLPITFKLG